jgi:hypothetical protein
VPDTGRLLTFQQPFLRLDRALKVLADSYREGQPMPFGTLADGRFFFRDVAPSTLSLPYASLSGPGLRWLKQRGDEAVTYATLLCLTAPSGSTGMVSMTDRSSYRAGTVTKTVVAPEHPTYRAATAAIPPAGADLLRYDGVLAQPTPPEAINPANVSDGNPATYATVGPGSAQFYLTYGTGSARTVGFRVVYEWINPPVAGVPNIMQVNIQHGVNEVVKTLGSWPLADTTPGVKEVVALLPPDARSIQSPQPDTQRWFSYVTLQLSQKMVTAEGQLRVYTFVPISIDEAKAAALASSLLRVPAPEAGEITLPRYVPAATQVSLPDAPGGAVAADAAEFARSHTPQGLSTTVIRFGRPGESDASYGLRLAAQAQAGVASTDVRAHLERG